MTPEDHQATPHKQPTDVRRTEDLVVEWRLEAARMEVRGLRESVRLIRSMADQL